MDKKNTLKVFETSELMSEAVAEFIVTLARESIAARNRFVIALSGGNTPNTVYSLLSSTSFKDKIEWKNTFVFWGDERCVPIDDERNNSHQARILLIDKIEIPSANIHPVPVYLEPTEAAKRYEEILRVFFDNEEPLFDLILLGLGENGHTASLFPGTSAIHESQRWVKEVYVAEQKEWRITMTTPLINEAANIAFLVSGQEKAKILKAILNGPYQPDLYPAQLIRPTHGLLYWFADKSALNMT
jgi:6-phosphogluconolactonase